MLLLRGQAGGVAGDGTASAIEGAQAGKTVVENNLMAGSEDAQAMWLQQHGTDMATCSDNPSGAASQKAQNEANAVAFAMASAGLIYLPGGMQVTAGIGGVANAGIQYALTGDITPTDVLIASYVGAFTANTGGWGAAGSAVGYGIGNKIFSPALDKVFNTTWKNYPWIDMGMGISKSLPPSPVPGMAGTATSSFATESTGQGIPKSIDELNKGSK